MKTRIVLACALTVAGCGKSSETTSEPPRSGSADLLAALPIPKPRPPKAPTGTPRPQGKLTVTLDGKPVAMATALAWRDWSGTIKITVSSVPVGCDEVTGDMRALHEGEVTFDVELARGLQPDGTLGLQQRSTWFAGSSHQETKPVAGTGDGTPGQPTTVDVDFASEDAGNHAGARQQLVVKGTIDAVGCAVPARAGAPPMPPEMPATLDVAGKKLPIRGAFLSQIGDWPELRLTTGSEGCTQVAFAPPGELEITLTWMTAGKPTVGQVTLGGSVIGNIGGDQTFDKAKLVVTPGPPQAGEVTLHGDIKANGYPVKLDGKVTVVACPK